MDSSYLAQQVSSSIGQLHGLFDEIGVPNHEREAREEEVSPYSHRVFLAFVLETDCLQLFAALSEALESQVRLVNAEKKDLVDEAKRIITQIRQMEASLDDSKHHRRASDDDEDIQITFPLNRCLATLREKHAQIKSLHKERFEQVKSEPAQSFLSARLQY